VVVAVWSAADVILFNPAAERLVPRRHWSLWRPATMAEPISRRFWPTPSVVPAAGHPLLRATCAESFITGAGILFPKAQRRGNPVWLAARVARWWTEGGGARGVVFFQIITARKLMEKQIAEISDRSSQRIGQDLHDGLCQHLREYRLRQRNCCGKTWAEPENRGGIAGRGYSWEMVTREFLKARNLARGLYPVRLEVDGWPPPWRNWRRPCKSRSGSIAGHLYETVGPLKKWRGESLPIAQKRSTTASNQGECTHLHCLGRSAEEVTLTARTERAWFARAGWPAQCMGLSS